MTRESRAHEALSPADATTRLSRSDGWREAAFAAVLDTGALGRALLEQSPFSTVVYAPNGRPLFANAAFERLWHATITDVPDDYTLVDDPQLERLGALPSIRRAFAGEVVTLPPVRYDVAEVTGVGRTTWTQAHLHPLRDATGAIIAVVLMHVDLTARIEAEAALASSEERLRVALQAGRMGTWEWTIADGQVRWSETLERLHGLAPGSFGGTFDHFVRDIHPDDRASVLATIQQGVDTGEHHLVYRIVRPDGAVRWLDSRGTVVRDGAGAPVRLIGVCTDVTEQKRSADATRFLAEASAHLASSLEYDVTLGNVARLAIPILADYCIIDLLEPGAPGGIRRVTTAHVDPRKEATVEGTRRFPPILDSDGIVARVLRSGEPQLVSPINDLFLEASAGGRPEHQAILRELAPRVVLCVPLVARGVTLGTILLVISDSERRYSADDLTLANELARRAALAVDNARLHRATLDARTAAEQAAAEARSANRAKSEFLAVMSHELRTPLNAIGGYAQLLEMGIHGPVTAEQLDDLARIQRSQRHLLSLINDLLNYAKLEAGRVQYRIEPIVVHDVLAGLEPLIAPQLAAKSLRYRYVPADPTLTVMADGEKLRQILLNLLSNAVKFTPDGGEIEVTTLPDESTATIEIADTGVGIPAEKLEMIFEPFVQLSRDLTHSNEGTGLGLAISRDLAHAMNGELTATSVVGNGSRFRVRLQRSDDRQLARDE